MTLKLSDPTAARWYDNDWPEPSEFEFLRQYGLGPGSRVFDVGAHQCVLAMMLAKVVGAEGLVVAVESNPHNAQIGLINKSLNELENIEILNVAASDTTGTTMINELMNGKIDATGRFGSLVVPSVSLDDLAAEFGRPGVVIIDVEGFECHVLRGCHDLLSGRANWCVEVHVGCGLEECGNTIDHVLSYFPAEKYRLFVGLGAEGSVLLDFHAFDEGHRSLKNRFFLMAISKGISEQ